MAESEADWLLRLYRDRICPYCGQSIPDDSGTGSGKPSEGKFCSTECYALYYESALIERHRDRLRDR